MFNEIKPYSFHPEFIDIKPGKASDLFCFFNPKGRMLFKKEGEAYRIPSLSDISSLFDLDFLQENAYYAGHTDIPGDESTRTDFYVIFKYGLDFEKLNIEAYNLEFTSLKCLRQYNPKHLGFAASTAGHINRWLVSRVFCGKCGTKALPSKTERAMVCPNCKLTEYPKINPAVIVAITDKNRILLTKDKNGLYPNYALVAGYMEIGESPLDTVIREVKEEVGVKIKNIKEYKAQPWGFGSALMLAFTAELDGDDTLTIQESELQGAYWFEREDVPVLQDHISVGQEMIEMFAKGKI
jgi:hypothetical protein